MSREEREKIETTGVVRMKGGKRRREENQFKAVSMRSEKPIIMLSTPSLRCFPNVAF